MLALLSLALTLALTAGFSLLAESWVREQRLVVGGFASAFCLLGVLGSLRRGLAARVLLWTAGIYFLAFAVLTVLLFGYYLPPALLLIAACVVRTRGGERTV